MQDSRTMPCAPEVLLSCVLCDLSKTRVQADRCSQIACPLAIVQDARWGTANPPEAGEVRQDRQNGRSEAEVTPELVASLRTRAEEAERELDWVSAAIGSVRFMDPPDGGSVSLAEQVSRMRQALDTAEAELLSLRSDRDEAREDLETVMDWVNAQGRAVLEDLRKSRTLSKTREKTHDA